MDGETQTMRLGAPCRNRRMALLALRVRAIAARGLAPVSRVAAVLGLIPVLGLAPFPGHAALPGPTAASGGDTLRVVAYNIKHGRGMDDRVDLQRVARVLRGLDADVIALQEVDDRTERTDRVDQVAVLAEALGYRGFHGPHRPYQGGHYGNAVLTRLPVREVRTRSIPPASGSALAVLEVRVDLPSGATASVVSVHLAGSVEERMAQAEAVTESFAGTDHAVVLAGDFNGRPGGPVVTRLRAEWQVATKSGSPYTYPADAPDREIDFVMIRPSDALEVLEHRVVPESMAADHRPLLAVLRFPSSSDGP